MSYLYMVMLVLVHLGLMPVSAGIEQTEAYATRLPYDIYDDIIEEQATPECLIGYYHWATDPTSPQALDWKANGDQDCVQLFYSY